MSNVRIFDGSDLSPALELLCKEDQLTELFQKACHGSSEGNKACPAECRSVALSLIKQMTEGVELPAVVLDKAFQSSGFPPDSGDAMDQTTFASKLRALLASLMGSLRDEPLAISVLDGSALRSLLEDEDDFAMLAEDIFTELDVDDTGKVGSGTLETALLRMGLNMGVPVPGDGEVSSMITSILEKHKCQGDQEIGQAQFAKLLQGVLEDIANNLAAKPVTLTFTANNGSQLRKSLENAQVFTSVADEVFDEFDTSKDGKLNRHELRKLLETRGIEWGFPPKGSSEELGKLYDDLFSICDADNSNEIERAEFHVLLREIFSSFASHLLGNPIIMG